MWADPAATMISEFVCLIQTETVALELDNGEHDGDAVDENDGEAVAETVVVIAGIVEEDGDGFGKECAGTRPRST